MAPRGAAAGSVRESVNKNLLVAGISCMRLQDLTALFRKYGEQYTIDYPLMMAKGYQESRLNQNVRSRVGAIGVTAGR